MTAISDQTSPNPPARTGRIWRFVVSSRAQTAVKHSSIRHPVLRGIVSRTGQTVRVVRDRDDFRFEIWIKDTSGLPLPSGASRVSCSPWRNDAVRRARHYAVLFDEPSPGLAPNIVERTLSMIRSIRDAGTTVLLVEQNAFAALELCDHAYLIEAGRIKLSGSGPEMMADQHVRTAYLGG